MKKMLVVGLVAVFALVTLGLSPVFAKAAKSPYKVGDDVYVCGCGGGCPCLTIAKKEGTCACGKPLVQTKIEKISRGKAYVKVNGKTEAFKLTGKYVCGCGAGCDCNTISQKAGKCACGKDLKAVKTTKKPAA